MRLRPRYSLLTLLILTALVAGGVKLWRGPHRHVHRETLADWPGDELEVQYDYVLNWKFNEQKQGVHLIRVWESRFGPSPKHSATFFQMFRNDEPVGKGRAVMLSICVLGLDLYEVVYRFQGSAELTPAEEVLLQESMRDEARRIDSTGEKVQIYDHPYFPN